MIEFILARYNYWIVIILMMTGLYIVFSRGNLVKTIVGLNLFQTSVFIFYITIGKVQGGTAPILLGGHSDDGHGDEHGTDHAVGARGVAGEHHGDAEDHHGSAHSGDAAHHDAGHDADHAPLSPEEAEAFVRGDAANALGELAAGHTDPVARESLHDIPGVNASNRLDAGGIVGNDAPSPHLETTSPEIAIVTAPDGHALNSHGADLVVDTVEVVYSNPLPHV